MKLQQLKFLTAVEDSKLSITAAAERLHTSQPGVSRQIKLLEEELGIELFVRKGRSLVEVTPAGAEVIKHARRILSEIDSINAIKDQHREDEERVISIATTHTQARYVLPSIITELKRRYPKLKLNLHQGTSEQIAELISRDEIDFAMASGSQNQFQDLEIVPCFDWDRIVLVPADHKLAQTSSGLTLEALAEFPLVTYVFSFGREASFLKAFASENLKPDVVFTARDADVIKTYVRMGMGVGVIASMAFEPEKETDLVAVCGASLFPRSTTWIGYRKDRVLRPHMQDLISLVSEYEP
ncbi:MAG: LysR substrate-binding domain-containing protein [Gammaproteobacteria bacterium]